MALKGRILAALGMLCLLAASASSLAQDRAATGFPGKPAEVDTRTWEALNQAVNKVVEQQGVYTLGGPGADGESGDNFGVPVALSGATALVGAYLDETPHYRQGSVYVFVRSGDSWSLQAKLMASDAAQQDTFGSSVALDGDTALIGASGDSIGSNQYQGSAYIFKRIDGVWTEQAKLIAGDGAASDAFGSSVALQGGTALIGAPLDDIGANANQGSAYVFAFDGAAWTQQTKRTVASGADSQFGTSVALSNGTAVVGADKESLERGAAYVFVRNGTSWAQQARLVGADSAAYDYFGRSVSISGDTVAIGAPSHDRGTTLNHGAVYVFVRSGTTWSLQSKVMPPSGPANLGLGISVAIEGDTLLAGAYLAGDSRPAYVFVRAGIVWTQQALLVTDNDSEVSYFGLAVAISGEYVLISASGDTLDAYGSSFVFARAGTSWSEQSKLTAGLGPGTARFGSAIAVSGDTAVIGAPGPSSGRAAYVFVRTGAGWSLQSKLVPNGGAASDGFGTSVAIAGNTVLVGAPRDSVGANSRQGAAYVFVRVGTTWTQQSGKLVASDVAAGDEFGWSVAIAGETAIIGAHYDDIGANGNQGSVYIFARSGSVWSQQAKLTVSNGRAGDAFGRSLALLDDTLLIGAMGRDVGSFDAAGAVFVFGRVNSVWTQQVELKASSPGNAEFFGVSVALSSENAIIGAYRDDVGFVDQGSAHVFVRNGAIWSPQSVLTASDGASDDQFGVSVSIDGDTALVGAYQDDGVRGAAYVYTRRGANWLQREKLIANDPEPQARFGWSVALSGDVAWIGASNYTGLSPYATAGRGAAYFFTGLPVIEPSSTTLASITPSPSLIGQSVTVAVSVTGAATRPTDGEVTVTATTGESCSGTSPSVGPPLAALFSCDLTFNTSGTRNVTAAFVNSMVHQDSVSTPAPHVVHPLPTLTINDVSLPEGNSGQTGYQFTVTRSHTLNTVSVQASSADGTAVSGTDYLPVNGLTLAFPAGMTSVTLTVPVSGDTVVELAETFRVNLANAVGATISDAQGLGTIVNDDSAVVAISNVALSEGNFGTTDANFNVTLAGEVQGGFTVPVSSASGTATTGSDFIALAPGAALNFQGTSGESRSVTVQVNGDAVVETNETFAVNLGAPSVAGVMASPLTGTGTITNDDSATVTLSDISQIEGDTGSSTFTFTAVLAGSVQGGFTVPYQTTNGTAQAGSDYTSAAGTLSFTGTNGQTRAIAVAVTGELVPELDETFHMDLSAPSLAGVTVSPNRRTGTILNDDLYADISVSNSNGTSSLQPGQVTVYAVEIANNSAVIDVPAVQVVQSLPAALIDITWTCSGSGAASCPASSGIGPLAATVGLPRGGSLSYLVSATVDGSAVAATVDAVVSASVLAPYADQNMGNNSATDSDVLLGNQIFESGFE